MSILTEWEINEIADKCKSSLGGVWPHAFYEVAEAMILEKLAGMELPAPNRHGGTYESSPFNYYTADQLHQAFAQGAASQLSAEPVFFAYQYSDGTYHDGSATEHSAGMKSLYTLKQPK